MWRRCIQGGVGSERVHKQQASSLIWLLAQGNKRGAVKVHGTQFEAKEHWLLHFREGLDSVDLTPEQDAQFWDYVTHAAQFMVNTFE